MGTIADSVDSSATRVITNPQVFEQTLENQEAEEEERAALSGCSNPRLTTNGANQRQIGSNRDQQRLQTTAHDHQLRSQPNAGLNPNRLSHVFKGSNICELIEQQQHCEHMANNQTMSQQHFNYNPLYMSSSGDHHLGQNQTCLLSANKSDIMDQSQHSTTQQNSSTLANEQQNHHPNVNEDVEDEDDANEMGSEDVLKDIYHYFDAANEPTNTHDNYSRINRKLVRSQCQHSTTSAMLIGQNNITELSNSPGVLGDESGSAYHCINDNTLEGSRLSGMRLNSTDLNNNTNNGNTSQSNQFNNAKRRSTGNQSMNRQQQINLSFMLPHNTQIWNEPLHKKRPNCQSMSMGSHSHNNNNNNFQLQASIVSSPSHPNSVSAVQQLELSEDCGGLFVEYQTNRNSLNGTLEELHSLNVSNVCDSETLEEQINMLSSDDCFVGSSDDLNGFAMASSNHDHLLNIQSLNGNCQLHQATITERYNSDQSHGGSQRIQKLQNPCNSSNINSMIRSNDMLTVSLQKSPTDCMSSDDTTILVSHNTSSCSDRAAVDNKSAKKMDNGNGAKLNPDMSSQGYNELKKSKALSRKSRSNVGANGMSKRMLQANRTVPTKITTTNTNKRLLPTKKNGQQNCVDFGSNKLAGSVSGPPTRHLPSGAAWTNSPSSSTSMSPSASLFDYDTNPYRQQLDNLRKKLKMNVPLLNSAESSVCSSSGDSSLQQNPNKQTGDSQPAIVGSDVASRTIFISDDQVTDINGKQQTSCRTGSLAGYVVSPGHEFQAPLDTDLTDGSF